MRLNEGSESVDHHLKHCTTNQGGERKKIRVFFNYVEIRGQKFYHGFDFTIIRCYILLQDSNMIKERMNFYIEM